MCLWHSVTLCGALKTKWRGWVIRRRWWTPPHHRHLRPLKIYSSNRSTLPQRPPCPHCHTILSSLIRPVRVITSTPPSHPSLLFVILSFHSLRRSLGEELRGLLSSHEVMIAVHVRCGQNSSGALAGSTSALVSCRATCYSVKHRATEVIYIPLRGDEYANPMLVDMEVLTVQDEWYRSLLWSIIFFWYCCFMEA